MEEDGHFVPPTESAQLIGPIAFYMYEIGTLPTAILVFLLDNTRHILGLDYAGKIEKLEQYNSVPEWSLMTLLDPAKSLENIVYIEYPVDPSSAVRSTKKRRITRKKQQADRNVFYCWVFGPEKPSKLSLLNSFLGRPFSDPYTSTTEEQYAVNTVEQTVVDQIAFAIICHYRND
ncbi:hypothetical protein MLD38_040802 [Melastoma candidum]|nr:hypothetical protein MLD38_040802 [Melastoma candidum]